MKWETGGGKKEQSYWIINRRTLPEWESSLTEVGKCFMMTTVYNHAGVISYVYNVFKKAGKLIKLVKYIRPWVGYMAPNI